MKYDKTRVIYASNQEKDNWYLVPAVTQNWLKQILCLTLKLSYLHGTTSSFDYLEYNYEWMDEWLLKFI